MAQKINTLLKQKHVDLVNKGLDASDLETQKCTVFSNTAAKVCDWEHSLLIILFLWSISHKLYWELLIDVHLKYELSTTSLINQMPWFWLFVLLWVFFPPQVFKCLHFETTLRPQLPFPDQIKTGKNKQTNKPQTQQNYRNKNNVLCTYKVISDWANDYCLQI